MIPFAIDEEERLLKAVEIYGDTQWTEVAKEIPRRTGTGGWHFDFN